MISLPVLNISTIAVAGCSHAADFSHQFHVAFSSLVDGACTLFQTFSHELNGLGATVASPKTSVRDVHRLRAVRRRTTTTSTSCARVRVAVMIT